MKTHLVLLAAIGAFSLAAAGSAAAHEDNSDAGTNHWLSHLGERNTSPGVNQLAPYGYGAGKAPDREVRIAQGDRYLNVTRMETVRIVVAGNSVVWTFDTLGTPSFPLDKIVPGASGVTVYVAETPTYGGS